MESHLFSFGYCKYKHLFSEKEKNYLFSYNKKRIELLRAILSVLIKLSTEP